MIQPESYDKHSINDITRKIVALLVERRLCRLNVPSSRPASNINFYQLIPLRTVSVSSLILSVSYPDRTLVHGGGQNKVSKACYIKKHIYNSITSCCYTD